MHSYNLKYVVSSEGKVVHGYVMNFRARVEVEILLFLNSPMYREVSICLQAWSLYYRFSLKKGKWMGTRDVLFLFFWKRRIFLVPACNWKHDSSIVQPAAWSLHCHRYASSLQPCKKVSVSSKTWTSPTKSEIYIYNYFLFLFKVTDWANPIMVMGDHTKEFLP